MANYISTIRSNYFHVKDEAAFRDAMSHVIGIELWDDCKDSDGKTLFGFCVDDDTAYYVDDLEALETGDFDYDNAYDAFLTQLQKHVAPDDAVIILESGHEKLRYVVGFATIITANEIETLDLCSAAIKTAAKMLGNPSWTTQCDY